MIDKTNKELLDVIAIFISKAESSDETKKLVIELKHLKNEGSGNDEAKAKLFLKISELLYNSSELSKEGYYFYQRFSIESLIFESRMINNVYDSELNPITDKMRLVEKKHGLNDDEYWTIEEYPPEYKKLNDEYEKVLDLNTELLYKKYAPKEIYEQYVNNNSEFNEIAQKGHIAKNNKDEIERLIELSNVYQKEAEISEKNQAFLASSILLGATIETKMIIKCLRNTTEIQTAIQKMGIPNKQIKSKNPVDWTLNTLIKVCDKCGWLPNIESDKYTFKTNNISHFLRLTRNLVHPGIIIKKEKTLSLDSQKFSTIKESYKLISLIIDN
ncbi:hypothetical protein KO493_14105 [Tamlana agarivorans]|uniref:Uncharacterized protein n=1 Tax=Pseudotamlana agarivorans TaxID=481183 RepID=A0ACC5UC48_9FLAO|nr:hypothetical protein [Tamlana agarivorans]MBU2951829.1 hypothetical protein [Tamlana agarivorans]